MSGLDLYLKYEKVRDSVSSIASSLFDKIFMTFLGGLLSKPSNILFLGLDNSGKSTLLGKMRNNSNHVYRPTKHTIVEELKFANLNARIFDIGGHSAARIAWKEYFHNVDGVVFIVDLYDEERFSLTAEAFNTILSLSRGCPILLLMNKLDLIPVENMNSFMSEIEDALGIDRSRKDLRIQYLSIIQDDIDREDSLLRLGFTWLGNRINANHSEKD